MPGATLCGTMIFSFGSPGTNILESPLVTSNPSEAILAFRIRNRISLFRSPDLVVGVFRTSDDILQPYRSRYFPELVSRQLC